MRLASLLASALLAAPGLCSTKPVQACKVTFSVVYLDRLNNTDYGIPAKNLKTLEKKLSAYGDVCYSASKQADLVFFIHTTPAVYHGSRIYTNNSTSAAAVSDSNGNAAAAAASSVSTTAIPYSVDYSVFILDIERHEPDGSFRIIRTLDQKGLYRTIYGIGYGKGKHPILNVVDAGAKWLHDNNLGR